MHEYVEVARARSPRGEVLLRERHMPDEGSVLELRVNGVFVMDTAETGSERALATRALALCVDPRTVLVGGLGLGFTVGALLDDERVRRVVVVEIEDALIGWLRAGTVPHGVPLLADPRVEVVHGDVAQTVVAALGPAYDLMLLDVDNGPGRLVHAENRRIYQAGFLDRCRRALRPGGALVVWAADDAPELEATMAEVFGACERIAHPVRLQGRQEEYLLYLSRAPRAAG